MKGRRIKPIPTYYMGINYRSRLEARWAMFLTLSHIPFVYEPFGTRTPDFQFIIKEVIVNMEIKPAKPTDQFLKYLKSTEVNLLAVGGFFDEMHPYLYIAPSFTKRVSFWTLFGTDTHHHFLQACQHRFDLR